MIETGIKIYIKNNEDSIILEGCKIHIIADNPPQLNYASVNKSGDNWLIENWQRSQINKGLIACKDEDVVIVSDLDEIPNPSAVRRYRDSDGVTCFEMDNYYFYLNFMSTIPPYRSIKMAKFRYYAKILPFLPFPKEREFCVLPEFRHKGVMEPNVLRQAKPNRIIKHGAWHFSFLGGAERVLVKRAALLEQNFYKGVSNDVDWVRRRLYEGQDPIGQHMIYYPTFAPWRLPSYVREKKWKWKMDGLWYRASLLHCLKLQMRYVVFRILALGACVVRRLFGHIKVIAVIKGMVVR